MTQKKNNRFATVRGIVMGNTAFVAVKNGDVDDVKKIFSAAGKLDVNSRINGCTALSWATKYKKNDVVNALLELNANVNQKNEKGYTALHVGVMENSTEIISVLIAAGANTNAKNDDGITPTHIACQYGYTMLLTKLIEQGAVVNCPDDQGITPFHIACTTSNHEILPLLLASGADLHAVTSDGSSPLHFACRHDRTSTVQFLIFNGVNVDYRNNLGQTALHDACINGCTNSGHVLMIYGADTTIMDVYGRTALQCSSFETSRILNFEMSEWSAAVARFSEPIIDFANYLESLKIPTGVSRMYASQMVIKYKFDSLCTLRECCENDPERIKRMFKDMGMENSVSLNLMNAFSGSSCLLS